MTVDRRPRAGFESQSAALAAALLITLGGCTSNHSDPAQAPARVIGTTPSAPVGFTAREFRLASPFGGYVVGGSALPRTPCAASQITATAATRRTTGGVLGVVRLVGRVVAHKYGVALRCALRIRRGPTAVYGADDQTLDVRLRDGDGVAPPSNPRPDLALDNGDVVWGFAWLGSSCGAHAATIELHLGGSHRGLRVPLSGPQPRCNPSLGSSVLIDGVAGRPGQPVQPARPEYSRLRLSGRIEAGTTRSRLAPIALTLRATGATVVALDPCPSYGGRYFAHAHSGGFGGPISSGTLPCTSHELTLGKGEVLHYTVPATNLQ